MALLMGILTAAPAAAQEAPPAEAAGSDMPAAPSDITVTARKRAENVQKVADPISVVTAKTIMNADLRTLQDAVRLTPNLVVIDGLYPGYKTVSFRGFTTLGRDGEFPFATIIDGVVQPGQMNFQQDLVNVQQIEILRGPQGTLYGGGAIAGAINIVTRQPTNEFEGSADAQWLTGPEGRFNVSLTGPIIKDKLFFQAGATVWDNNGLIPNDANRKNADFGKGITSRASLIWKGTENLKVALTASTTDSRVGGLFLAPVPDSEFDTTVVDPDENQAGIVRTRLRNYSAKIDYDFPDFATLTSITAYSKGHEHTTADGDFSPEDVNTQAVFFTDRAWSQEVRLTSNTSGPFKWNVGAYYQDEKRRETSYYGAIGAVLAPNDAERHYQTTALFGQFSYAFTDRLEFTGGFRYDWETQHYVDLAPVDPTSPYNKLHQKFSEPQGKASLSYKITNDIMTYASYSRGYRKGGFNPRSEDPAFLAYAPETADNYEIGFKSSFWDHKITFNGAAFYTNFKGQQFSTSRVIPGQAIFIAISNIDQTKVLGFEAETTIRPVNWLSFSGSVGYSNAKIKKFLPENPTEYHDNVIPQIYGFTAMIGTDIDLPLSDTYSLVAHGDWSHRGSVYWDVQNELKTSPRDFFNAKVGVRKGDWTLSFVGRNLSNARTPAAVGPHAFGTSSLVSYNEPRQYGVELGVKF
jgi:iron complex outermembrane recepter protein